uniref:Bicarbonate transporter-like transmembrane domain-containing protein n=1 Tax=Romanomermis culicivorax TaxID=13658 RepID=A0A915K363_ROMCU
MWSKYLLDFSGNRKNLLLKKERCLVKPSGFHWDLIVMGALTFMCPVFGLQWVCPAAVQSIAHAQSLSVMKKTAPGEAAQIDFVLEQRVTAILIAVLHGLAAGLGFILVFIPSSALFGLFLFLGVIGLMNIQLWNRILLIFVPSKYFPKQPYCMDVSIILYGLFVSYSRH